MRKNKMMRAASALLVAVLLTTSVISGTFAKYVSTASATDTARVAYWGFGLDSEIAITDLFVNTYGTSVDSKDDDDVIAPGTNNYKTFKFAYTNATEDPLKENSTVTASAPEVAYTFQVDVSGCVIDDAIRDNPNIEWAIVPAADADALLAAPEDAQWGTWEAMLTELKGMSGDASDGIDEYAPNEAPAAFAAGTEYAVAWQWKFSTSTAQDIADTVMGNKAVLDDVTVSIAITATQTD